MQIADADDGLAVVRRLSVGRHARHTLARAVGMLDTALVADMARRRWASEDTEFRDPDADAPGTAAEDA